MGIFDLRKNIKKINHQDIGSLFETSIFIGKTIKLMTMFLEYNNYDIEFSDDTMTIVKHSDAPWNHFNKYIAKADGVYNYVEIQMGGYDVKKRVSCCNFKTACFLTLAMFISKEKSFAQETLLLEIKKHANTVAKNSTDYWNGQFIIDELILLTK